MDSKSCIMVVLIVRICHDARSTQHQKGKCKYKKTGNARVMQQ